MINENTAVLMCYAHIFGPDEWRKSSSSFLVFFDSFTFMKRNMISMNSHLSSNHEYYSCIINFCIVVICE